MNKVRSILIAVMAVAVVAPASAAADDASMKRAWDSQDAAFTENGKSFRKELKAWSKRGHTRDAKLLRLLKRGEALLVTVEQAVNAEQPSTPQGTEAKTWILKSLATFKGFFRSNRSAVRAAPSKRAERLAKEADAFLDQSEKEAKTAKDLLAQVGVR